jgi:DNA-binding transcriptional ArsR family regulator
MIKPIDRSHLEEAAAMFKALSDPARLQTLITLAAGNGMLASSFKPNTTG